MAIRQRRGMLDLVNDSPRRSGNPLPVMSTARNMLSIWCGRQPWNEFYSTKVYDAVEVMRRALAMGLVLETAILLMSPHGLNHALSPQGYQAFNLRHFHPLTPALLLGLGINGRLPLPQSWLTTTALVTGALAAILASGFARNWARSLTAALWLGWTWLWTAEATLYNNHSYLYSLLLAMFLLGLPGSCKQKGVRIWLLPALRWQLLLVYIWAAVAKFDPDWLNGSIAVGILGHPRRRWLLELLGPTLARTSLAWGGLLIDLLAPALLMAPWRRLRAVGQLLLLFFHCTNTALFGVSGIGAFSFVMVASMAIFPEGLVGLPEVSSVSNTLGQRDVAPKSSATKRSFSLPSSPAWILILVNCHLILQTVVPGMQFWQPHIRSDENRQPAAWTKYNDRFAWRMKSTLEAMTITIPPKNRGKPTQVALCALTSIADEHAAPKMLMLEQLNPSQREEVCIRPASLLQFAVLLQGTSRDRRAFAPATHIGYQPVNTIPNKLYANTWLALNGHPFQPRFNSTVNLINTMDKNKNRVSITPHMLIEDLMLPWDRSFGSFDDDWRPVWKEVHTRYADNGYLAGNFSLEEITP